MDIRLVMREFEEKMIAGYKSGVISSKKLIVIISGGKLSNSRFGQLLRGCIDTDEVLAINYYGYHRISWGIHTLVENYKKEMFPCIDKILSPTINFASVNPKTIEILCPGSGREFDRFRREIISQRWKK